MITSNADDLNTISSYIKDNDNDIEVLSPGPMKSNKGKLINFRYFMFDLKLFSLLCISFSVYISQKWNKPLTKSKLVLICSDDMMFDFYIDNADCLIHYDIPADKRTFSIRFSVLQDSNDLLTVS